MFLEILLWGENGIGSRSRTSDIISFSLLTCSFQIENVNPKYILQNSSSYLVNHGFSGMLAIIH